MQLFFFSLEVQSQAVSHPRTDGKKRVLSGDVWHSSDRASAGGRQHLSARSPARYWEVHCKLLCLRTVLAVL